MEYKHIRDIDLASSINSRVFAIFMARDVEVRLQKDGTTKYINLNICDKDFKIDAKKFGASESEIEMMKSGCIYRGAIDVKEYAKSPTGYSCIIYNFEPHDESPSNFVEWADGMDRAQNNVQHALNSISESIYSNLVANIIIPIWDKFAVWTAASSCHHDILGGLLVHTGEVIEQAEQIADLWEDRYGPNFINKELLLSAALLHDVGKIEELSVDASSGSTEYSITAALENHITIGATKVEIEAYKLGIGYQEYETLATGETIKKKSTEQLESEKEAVRVLKHCILAHHGKKEYGSPIDMNCPEALILNIADNLSAEMYRYSKNFKKMEASSSHTTWLNGTMLVTYKDSTKE